LSGSNQSSASFEVITTKEVLERLRISRAKLFELKKNGNLIPGRHFFKNGRTLRFVWSHEMIEAIHENPADLSAPKNPQYKKCLKKTPFENKKSTINLDY
jgi:hypothetical protein